MVSGVVSGLGSGSGSGLGEDSSPSFHLGEIDAAQLEQHERAVLRGHRRRRQRSERPAAYELSRSLLDRCAKGLLSAIHSFLHDCLPNALSAEAAEESELRDEWRPLVVELARCSPDTVTYLLPQLEGVASMEDEETRLLSTQLLGEIFALEGCDVAKSVPSLFDSGFLGRMKDVSPAVRAAAVEVAVTLVTAKPHLAPRLLDA